MKRIWFWGGWSCFCLICILMPWKTINHWAHSPVSWGKKGIAWKSLEFSPCFIRFHLATEYLALYWLFLSFCFHSCCCQAHIPSLPHCNLHQQLCPSTSLPAPLPSTPAGFSSPPLESKILLKDLGIAKYFCEKLPKNLKEKKNHNKDSKEQWRRSFPHLAENLQGSTGQTLLMLGWVIFSLEICCV